MMQESGRRRDGPQAGQGHEILREAAQLLSRMSFWSNRGAYAEGRYVAISVDPHWNDDNGTIQVALTCYAFGHGQVDWQGLLVLARPAAGNASVYGITRLDARGQGIMTRLQPDDYRLFVPERYGRSEAFLPFCPSPALGSLAAATENVEAPFEPHIYDSPDGSLRATVRQSAEGTTIAAFETWETLLAGAVVYVAFVREPGDVLQSAEVQLTPVEEEPGLLEARWEAEIEFTERCTFEFGIVPRDA
jgi:hypothetical protein